MSLYWNSASSNDDESDVKEQEQLSQKKREEEIQEEESQENIQEEEIQEKESQKERFEEESILQESDQEDSRIDDEVSSSTKLKSLNKTVNCYVLKSKKKTEFVAWWTTTKWSYNNEKKLIKLRKKNYLKIEEKDVSLKAFLRESNHNERCS